MPSSPHSALRVAVRMSRMQLGMIFDLLVLPRPNWGIEQDESFEPMARKFSFTVNATIGELQLGVRPHISGFGVFCM